MAITSAESCNERSRGWRADEQTDDLAVPAEDDTAGPVAGLEVERKVNHGGVAAEDLDRAVRGTGQGLAADRHRSGPAPDLTVLPVAIMAG